MHIVLFFTELMTLMKFCLQKTLLLCLIATAALGQVSAWSQSLWVVIVFRFITGKTGKALLQLAFIFCENWESFVLCYLLYLTWTDKRCIAVSFKMQCQSEYHHSSITFKVNTENTNCAAHRLYLSGVWKSFVLMLAFTHLRTSKRRVFNDGLYVWWEPESCSS